MNQLWFMHRYNLLFLILCVTLFYMKSEQKLKSFVEYCQSHPQERFWQALRNWSEANFILTSKVAPHEMDRGAMLHDTFYDE